VKGMLRLLGRTPALIACFAAMIVCMLVFGLMRGQTGPLLDFALSGPQAEAVLAQMNATRLRMAAFSRDWPRVLAGVTALGWHCRCCSAWVSILSKTPRRSRL
jgi:hypothetical protein